MIVVVDILIMVLKIDFIKINLIIREAVKSQWQSRKEKEEKVDGHLEKDLKNQPQKIRRKSC
ncbi:MAG: hypothetical protein PHF94_07300 [Methanothrix sp.]|nr:hypothetical protein [Methanothrix sp.]MDD4579147.1 hypothetical protein [Methanothrix sp.]